MGDARQGHERFPAVRRQRLLHVARGVVTLSDGSDLRARPVGVPGTGYRAWAVAIPAGKTIASVDQYHAGDHRLSHETSWR